MNTVDKPFLDQCNFCTQRRNKGGIISPVSLLQLQSVVVHTAKPKEDKDENPVFIVPPSVQVDERFEVLLLKFFKVSYYLGIVPFHLNVVVLKNGKKRVETSRPGRLHTTFVVFVHICTAIRCLMLFTLLSYNLKDPLNYFEIARTALSGALCWFFIWTVWMKHRICKEILYRLSNLNYFANVTIFKLKWVEHTVISISLILLYATSVYPAIEECSTRFAKFCQQDHFSSYCQPTNDREYFYYGAAIGKTVFVVVNYFGHTTRRYPRMKLLVISLTLWEVCKSFGKSIKESSRKKRRRQENFKLPEIRRFLDAYEDLKEISNLIRKLVGKMLTTEIVEDILYFSLEVQLRLREADWFSVFVVVETWLVAFLAYYIAACAAEPIHEVSKWLARDDVLSQLSPGKIATLHSQLGEHPIGLKGGNLFTITKNFLANVVTVWLTYFIILLQFQSTLP